MFHRRNYSLEHQPESRAVASLLDCSNTLKVKNSSKTLKREQDAITPWIHLNRRPLSDTRTNCTIFKTNRNFTRTYHKHKAKHRPTPTHAPLPPHAPLPHAQNKTVLSTPKNRVILDEIENYNYLSSNVINLTRELQLIHHKRKTNYMSNYIRQQLYLRLKTT